MELQNAFARRWASKSCLVGWANDLDLTVALRSTITNLWSYIFRRAS